MTISAPETMLFAFLLVSIRLAAFFVVAPPFASRSVPARVKAGMAFALALPVTGGVMKQGVNIPDAGAFLTSVAYQIVVGALMGFIVLLLFTAIQSAGMYIDYFSMFAMSSMLDPISGAQVSMYGRINQIVATTLLFTTGGHLIMVRGVATSFDVLPVRTPQFGDIMQVLATQFGRYSVAALEIGGPIIVALFLTDVAMGLVSRAVPSLNVFQLAFPVKTLLTVSVAGIGVSLLPAAVNAVTERAVNQMGTLVRLMGG